VTISSNATSGATSTISLTGTGSSTAYRVELNWAAPANSSAAVTGYHIYRAPSGSTSYQLLNTAVNTPTTYTDTAVQSGTTYTYQVMSVDAAGAQSAPSNVYTAAIP
jgi:fibronectin type 3 domain-containing protein